MTMHAQPSAVRPDAHARRAKVEQHNSTAAGMGKLLTGLNFPGEWDLTEPRVVPKAGKA
jgi:hypothetical protein